MRQAFVRKTHILAEAINNGFHRPNSSCASHNFRGRLNTSKGIPYCGWQKHDDVI